MKYGTWTSVALLIMVAISGTAWAQHTDHVNHTAAADGTVMPTERGDASFTAIAEIVQLLRQDPDTDWSRVDIDGLRTHLVDMTELIRGARVETTALPDGLQMRVSVTDRAGESASRMVPAHGPVLATETGWVSHVNSEESRISWTVTDPTGADTAQIQALGFFGLMTIGDHHRAHHIAIAKGHSGH